jgi:hypothetical protein
MLREERRWNHIKCSVKPQEAEKEQKTKTGTKNQAKK